MKRVLTTALATTTLAINPTFTQAAPPADSRDIGEVSTSWNMIGANDKVKIMGFADPDIQGVTCFISRSVKGGIGGALNIAEDKSEASVACRQTGPIKVLKPAALTPSAAGTEVFSEKRSILFKELHITRHYDKPSGCWTYLTWSDRLVNGSSKNSLSAICPQQMQTAAP